MFKKILLSKFLVVILLSFLSVSFSYANDHNCEQLLNEVDNDAALCFKAEETKDVCYLKEVEKRGLTCPPSSDKIPKNSHKDGSSWTCDTSYYRNNAQTACMNAPANSTSPYSSNDFKCNTGYEKSENSCSKAVGVNLTSIKPKLTMFAMYAFILVFSIFTLILIIKYFGDGITKKLRNVLTSINKKNGSKKDPKPLSESLSVPKEPEIKISTSDIEGNISYQTESIKNLKNDVSILMKSIKDMNDTFMTLKANLDQKDEEISRLKDGYDSTIFRGFILRFTRVDKVLKENLKDKKYSLDALEDIQIQMEDALAECSIEIFSPALGADFKTSEGVADNPKQIDTTDKNKNLTIAEVIQPGYRRRLPNSNDDDFQIITEAKVAIYIYKD